MLKIIANWMQLLPCRTSKVEEDKFVFELLIIDIDCKHQNNLNLCLVKQTNTINCYKNKSPVSCFKLTTKILILAINSNYYH